MFNPTLKFIDGSPVPVEYQARVSAMVADACTAQDWIPLDELERGCDEDGS